MTIKLRKGKFIDEKPLTKEEAVYFLAFLQEELDRHINSWNECVIKMQAWYGCPILSTAYRTSAERHYDDITYTLEKMNLIRKHHKITDGYRNDHQVELKL